ncbi:MAG: thiamine pyrophosphate-dependent enzyme, partial [Solirubrobacteraceae bacterium]
VREGAAIAVRRARDGEGPTLLECRTYRHFGHSKGDPAPYRTKGEVEQWLARDPLKIARDRLASGSGVSEEEITAAEDEIEALIERTIENALAAPYPDPAVDAATEYSA